MISLIAAVLVSALRIFLKSTKRTEQRAYHLEVPIQKIVEHPKYDTAEGVLRVPHRARSEDVESGARWARVV